MNTTANGMRSWRVLELDSHWAGAVHELEKSLFPCPWTTEQIGRGLDQGTLFVLGAVEGGVGPEEPPAAPQELLGYLSWYGAAGEAEIVNVAVQPAWRRHGLGRALLDRALQNMARGGIDHVYLEVRVSNAPAIGLYASTGFRRTGVRRGYYPDTGEDALRMALELAS